MSRQRVYTEQSTQIMQRFFTALEIIIANKMIRGTQTYCRLYGIERRNLILQRKDLTRGHFQASWLVPMVKNYGISADWLLTGKEPMFAAR